MPRAAAGCLLLPAGFFGGGMIGVGIATIVGELRRCPAPDGLPACNTIEYMLAGGIVGALVLVAVVQWRMGRRGRGEQSERS